MADNPFRYASYQYDEETDMYYLNARMYDAKYARFLQEDTYRGRQNDPLSLNLYTYTLNNPIRYYDPSGHYPSDGTNDNSYTTSYNSDEEDDLSKDADDSNDLSDDEGKVENDFEELFGKIVSVTVNTKSGDEIPEMMNIEAILNGNYEGYEDVTITLWTDNGEKIEIDTSNEPAVSSMGTGKVDESDFLVTTGQLEQFFDETGHFQAGTVDSTMIQDLNRVLTKYGIDTPDEIQMFMATIAHESKTALIEDGVGDTYAVTYIKDGVEYEVDYRGGGYSQLTGWRNYEAFAKQMVKEGLLIDYEGGFKRVSGESFKKYEDGFNPILAGGGAEYVKENFAWEAAGWHWTAPGNNINNRIENGADFYKVSQVINGGPSYAGKPNGWNDRQNAYTIAQQIFK